MAKMMRKAVALAITMSMLLGVVVLPARAEETEVSGETTVTVEITNDSGKVIGDKTTVTTTSTSENDDSYHSRTDTETSWSSQDTTVTPAESVTEGNTTTRTGGETVTEVTGSEASTDRIDSDKNTGVQTLSGSTSGSEDTTITETTTTVTTATDVTFVDTTEGPVSALDSQIEEGPWSDLIPNGEGDWVQTASDDQDFEPLPGTERTETGTNSPIDVDEDPLENTDVALEMTAPTGSTPSTDSETLFVSLEDALENDIPYTDGQILEGGGQVRWQYDAAGNVTGYSITTVTPTGNTPGEIVPGTPGGAVAQGDEVRTYIKPEGYTPCTEEPFEDENGNAGTRTVEEILDEEGNVIGYTITEKVITQSGAEETRESLPVPEPSYTLPERPVAPPPVTENGLTTTVTVEEVTDAGGNVMGYKTIKTVTDEDGNEVSMESETIYGTATTRSSSLVSTPVSDEVVTTTVTTVYGTLTTQNYITNTTGSKTDIATRDVTQESYELVQTDDGLFFLFEGKMYQVEAISGGDFTQGQTEMTSLQPNISGLEPGGAEGTINSTTDLRASANFSVTGGPAEGYELQYIDYGLESRIKVGHDSGSTLAHQFVLKDKNGNLHYVLCVDFDTSAVRGASYNMDNVINSGYFDDPDTAKRVEAIALNGYWGTTSGTGSLDHVKQILRDAKAAGLISLSDEEINNITPGEALTATQAALWHYGDSSGSTHLGNDVTGPVYNNSSNRYSTRNPYASESSTVNALYKALINLDISKVSNNTTELLNETNFATGTQLVIKEKATDSSGNVKTDANGNEKFLTDLTFTVDVKKSDLTGNLVVTITDEEGNELHEPIQLKTDDSNLVGKVLADGTAGTDYTIRDLELPAGVSFNLNLSGTQNLSQGAYLYTAEVYSTSQTFIGVATGTQEVNLNVKMEFDVTDPEAEIAHTTKTWSEKEVDTFHYTKLDQFKREKKGTETSQSVTVRTTVTGTTVQTDITEKTTDLHRDWRSSYLYQLVTTDGEDDGEEEPTGPDQDAPRAKAPKTGDVTGILAAVCLFSAGGLMVLNRKREEDDV